ncbi:uncharacterized protein DUF4336 [Rhodothalassium salexigens DSM 2132]|uniref:Uncharacterized protein DUF4336 n=1 Tax=Rhodothalassium salexigens DSM 2132 TaxID=1188247 RepID=A0A4R2PTZ6_RHOSA|nr:DUF4336 domain-containing protein [Rhodothalassium salexigens]MBB4210814.1 hypothetical protein [Rhodothalassium salexigens DSM 2132]MBK1639425.1 hypothetical protein [Rhodothalassium salexigens DSM 2132]TCP37631.1 uncharacterized protein DUF4336 [Rhodothalassium salexigens DSM 2132]
MTTVTEALRPIGPDIWLAEGPEVRFYGVPVATRMTVVRLACGGLWLHSPVAPSPALHDALDALGPVRHLVAPNRFHHGALGAWVAAYPDAVLHEAPGLGVRRPDLRFDAALGSSPAAAWADTLDQTIFGPSWYFDEVVFHHRASRTLILTDLIMNLDGRRYGPALRWLGRLDGALAPTGGVPRTYRWSLTDRVAARRVAEMLIAWAPERVVFAHGAWFERDGTARLARAFEWLVGRPDAQSGPRTDANPDPHPDHPSAGRSRGRAWRPVACG